MTEDVPEYDDLVRRLKDYVTELKGCMDVEWKLKMDYKGRSVELTSFHNGRAEAMLKFLRKFYEKFPEVR